jgi:hypothetical protein
MSYLLSGKKARLRDPSLILGLARSMRLALACLTLIALCISAQARTHSLLNGTSPNGQFRVQAAEKGLGEITYEVLRRRDSAVLHRSPSSYQPEEGAGDWPWNESIDAEIHWSADSRYVVIDEQVHNYIGTVFIVSVRPSRVDPIALPEEEILSRTGLHWDRYRIRAPGTDAWSLPHHLLLFLVGQVRSGTSPDGSAEYEHRTFDIELFVDKRRATIAACRDVTKKE